MLSKTSEWQLRASELCLLTTVKQSVPERVWRNPSCNHAFHKMANLPPTLACEQLGLSRIAPFIPNHNFLCLLPLLSQSFEMCQGKTSNAPTSVKYVKNCQQIIPICLPTLFYTVSQLFGNLSCTSIYLLMFMFLDTDVNFKAPKCKQLLTRRQRSHWDGGLATSGRSSAVWQWLKYSQKKKVFFRHISWCSSEVALHPRACKVWLEWLTALIKFVCSSLICKRSSL